MSSIEEIQIPFGSSELRMGIPDRERRKIFTLSGEKILRPVQVFWNCCYRKDETKAIAQ